MIKRGIVHGVGINDSEENVFWFENVDGVQKKVGCKYYTRWKGVLERCFCPKLKKDHPTYNDCTICDDWKYFTKFKAWMMTQDWEGKQLDKDLLFKGNKHYSPETCVFIDQRVNKFVTDGAGARGEYMIGVFWHKRDCKFVAKCCNPFTGKRDHLGYHTTELAAHLAWKTRKHELACQLADSEYVTDERVAQSLRTWYLL